MEGTFQDNLTVLLAPLETGQIVEQLTEQFLSLCYLHEFGEQDLSMEIYDCQSSLAYYKNQYRMLCN